MAQRQDEAFLFFVERWRGSRSVQRMTFAERGIFLEMMIEQWLHGHLPDDPQAVGEAIALTSDQVVEVAAAWPVVRRQYVTVESVAEPRIVNLKLESVRKERDRYIRWRRKLSQLGGRARAKQLKTHGEDGTPSARRRQPDGERTLGNRIGSDRIGSDQDKKRERSAREDTPLLLAPRPAEHSNPDVRAFLEWFPDEFKSRRHGADYLVNWARDGAIVKKLLKATSVESLQQCAQILLSDKCEDDWIQTTDRGIPILAAKFNWLSDRLAQWKTRQHAGTA